MTSMTSAAYLDDARRQFRKLKQLADAALLQAGEERLFAALSPESNSIAIVLKHLSGNLRSRWTDFLGSDGEKPDRDRDREFVIEPEDIAAALRARWETGWRILFTTLDGLAPEDLARTVTIRGEPHTVLQALNRQMTHYAYHVGQIVLLARHGVGPDWKSLSIPRGMSKRFEVSKDGEGYPVEPGFRTPGG